MRPHGQGVWSTSSGRSSAQERDWLACWWTRSRPAWAGPAPCLPSSSLASSPDAVSFAKGIAGGLPLRRLFWPATSCAGGPDARHPRPPPSAANPVCAAAARSRAWHSLDDDAPGGRARRRASICGPASRSWGWTPWRGGAVGMGLMLGVEVRGGPHQQGAGGPADWTTACSVLTAGRGACACCLPLAITMEEMDKGLAIMESGPWRNRRTGGGAVPAART